MNKDLDERLVPRGEYREALNIQVSTSEGPDVGALENILGNETVSSENFVDQGVFCVGSIADEANNALYYFVSSPDAGYVEYQYSNVQTPNTITSWNNLEAVVQASDNFVWRDKILKIQNGNITPVFVDGYQVKTTFADNNDGAGLGPVYQLNATSGISAGMVCYFFNGPNHGLISQSGSGENTFSGPSDELYGASQSLNPVFYGSRSVRRTVISAVYNGSNIEVVFDKDLSEEHQNNQNLLGEMAYVNVSDPGYNYLVFVKPRLLNFDCGSMVTGINILDDFLMWTDNKSEPKKISIKRSIEGTPSALKSTLLLVPERDIVLESNILVKEEHITVIKKYPTDKLIVEQGSETPTTAEYDGNFVQQIGSSGVYELVEVGKIILAKFGSFDNGNNFDAGDELRFLNQSSSSSLPSIFDVRCKVDENLSGQPVDPSIPGQNWPANTYKLEILSVSPTTPFDSAVDSFSAGPETFNVERVLDNKSLFEKKFVRFGYRWKYQDGEYSSFSPFTDTVFSASFFEYDATLGHNKAMLNYLTSIKLRQIIAKNIPDDVVQVDLLYIESNSTTVYIVDKIKFKDYLNIPIGKKNDLFNHWTANQYNIKSDLIYSAVPANQILRPWDNVPRKALAQEVTGNRLVFANYLQNYSIINEQTGSYTKPMLTAGFAKRWNVGLTTVNFSNPVLYDTIFLDSIGALFPELNFPYLYEKKIEPLIASPSLKSIRSYQLGFTYLDEYGRETPVFSNSEATVEIPKKEANEINLLTSRINTTTPDWAKSFKMYIKEISNEYYNLALDRVYKAEDGNLWLSFPSSERNKVDEETYLILKKGSDSNSLVTPEARYKIIAIENEAPDFLKTKTRLLAEGVGVVNGSNPAIQHLFDDGSGVSLAPILGTGEKSFKISVDNFADESSVDLSTVEGLMQFDFKDNTGKFSKKYNVVNISKDNDAYTVVLETPILAAESWMFEDLTTIPFTDSLKIRFYKSITRVKPEFDGKFFVKINGDSTAAIFLNTNANSSLQYQVVASMSTYYFSDTGKFGITEGATGNTIALSNVDSVWNYYTSSGGTNPHTGQVGSIIHPGSVNTPESNLGVESTDGDRDWINALDFGTSTVQSNWFIDEVYYAGSHAISSSNSVNSPNHVTNSASQFNYGNGIHESNNQNYIEVSYSRILPSAVTGTAVLNKTTAPEINYADFNDDRIWEVGNAINNNHVDQADIVSKFITGSQFRISGDSSATIYTITGNVTKERRYNFAQWALVQTAFDNWFNTWTTTNTDGDTALFNRYEQMWNLFGSPENRRVSYLIPVDKDVNTTTISDGTNLLPVTAPDVDNGTANGNTPVIIQFIEQRTDDDNDILLSNNPAIFETEPKESIDVNIFYEISDAYPTSLNINTAERWVPKGSVVTCKTHPGFTANIVSAINSAMFVTGFEQGTNGKLIIKFNYPLNYLVTGAQELAFTRADGGFTTLTGDWYPSTPVVITSLTNPNSGLNFFPDETGYEVNVTDLGKTKLGLSWFNAYSFGNGVESNRLRDDFNQVFISKGVKASTTLESNYEEERRHNGLIYSGIYNSTSGTNNLNQFIQAEKITKDINPTYGSIQKLFSRNTDLISFCEDRVIRIAANKDAIFNADGNPQLIASPNVLGQVLPFTGDYGISKNPESFAFESYRAYFTDAKRGAVLRLSKDGLTNIADYGMSDYFKKNLKLYDKVLGSYDDKKENYNLTLADYSCNKEGDNVAKTVTFSETIKGWTSFMSFIPEQAMSMENNYYTFKDGTPWKHHVPNVDRNTFYYVPYPSTVEFYLNQEPDSVKSFKTLNYEGSQARVYEETVGTIDSNPGQGYYNLQPKIGWDVLYIKTDLESGKIQGNQFVEKEGKWFNYIQGDKDIITSGNLDSSNFNIQGIGRSSSLPASVFGCTNPNAVGYNPLATVDDGSCGPMIIYGCMDNGFQLNSVIPGTPAYNYYPGATVDDGSCIYDGCMNAVNPVPGGIAPNNYQSYYTVDLNNSCTYDNTYDCNTLTGGFTINTVGTGTYTVQQDAIDNCPPCGSNSTVGCTDSTMMNYDPTPGVCHDQTTCIPYTFGCYDDGSLDTTLTNGAGYPLFVPLQTQLNSATNNNCTVGVLPYFHNSYSYTDPFVNSSTYNTVINVSANNVISPMPTNAGMDCGCEYTGCMDNTNSNYMPWATTNDATMCCIDGCTDITALNYDSSATCDDGSCLYTSCALVTLRPSSPWNLDLDIIGNNNQKYWSYIGSDVFEKVLEYAGNNLTGFYGSFDNDPSNIFTDTFVCTKAFNNTEQLNITGHPAPHVSSLFVSSEPHGTIQNLTGLEQFVAEATQSSADPYFKHLRLHLLNFTSFINNDSRSGSPYAGINMLETIVDINKNFETLSLKSIDLTAEGVLNLPPSTLKVLELCDTGLEGVDITSTNHPNIHTLAISNHPVVGTNANCIIYAQNSTFSQRTAFPGVCYDQSDPDYPSQAPNLSLNYGLSNSTHRKLGSSVQSGNGVPNGMSTSNMGNLNDFAADVSSNNGVVTVQQTRTAIFHRLILINLPELEHVYIEDAWNYAKAQNQYTNSGATQQLKHAGFTTLGCHPDLKIHVGSLSRINQFEGTYGTNNPNSDYYSTNSSNYFLRYFGPNHRFVI